MNEITLPPSPNWYLSNILACSKRKTLAWGCKNTIIIAKCKEDNATFQYFAIPNAHKDRVTMVAFCPNVEPNDPELLLSCGDDDTFKIWDLNSYQLTTTFSYSDGRVIVGVEWSIKDKDLVFAVNVEGCIISCQIQYGTITRKSLGKITATCFACCPHDSNLVAVGTKSGLIYITDIRKTESILHKMRGHDIDITCLSWCPSDTNIFSKDSKRDLLLASAAKDKSVFIWKAGKNSRYETIISLPNQPINSQQHKSKLGTMAGFWTVVRWVEPGLLLTNSGWGELLCWTLSAEKSKPTCELFHTYHNRGLFCIAISPKDNVTDNLSETDPGLTVWTLAQDRWIVCACKEKDKPAEIKHKIPTQAGFIYCIAASPLDTANVAFGAGDAMLRLWNLSDPNPTLLNITMLWQRIKGKIRSIAWHPEKENLIAFGTGEGRVGVFDTNGCNKPPIIYRQYHRDNIYKLEWATILENKHHFLFSCAKGELIAYDPAKPDAEPLSILKKGCTEFSWKPDGMCLAVAVEAGSIILYDRDLQKIGNILNVLNKSINCLAWHPDSTATDLSLSPMRNYLAIGSDMNGILILDLSRLFQELTSSENKDEDTSNSAERNYESAGIVTTLNAHHERVVCLAWSPHFSGYLVSGSYDNTAQVWNVEKQVLVGTFTGHHGPILSCMWSPLNPQLIITGSADFFLSIWNYTKGEQTPKRSTTPKKKKSAKAISPSNIFKLSMGNSPPPALSKNHTERMIKASMFKDSDIKQGPEKRYFINYHKFLRRKPVIMNSIRKDIYALRKELNLIEKDKENNDDDNNDNNDNDGDNANANVSDSSVKYTLLADDKIFDTINAEKQTHAMLGNYSILMEMSLWSDDLKSTLDQAVKEKRLNDFTVALSASLSVKKWRETCEAYANQLVEKADFEKAVAYLLAIHKVYDAIETCLIARLYNEAYAIAKSKLDCTDPFFNHILENWAEYATKSGHLEQAAHCHMKLGNLEQASKLLSRRKDAESLHLASQIAFLNQNDENGISLAKIAVTTYLHDRNYKKAYSVINDTKAIQYLKVYVKTHKNVVDMYNKDSEFELVTKWLAKKYSEDLLQFLQKQGIDSCYETLLNNIPRIIEDPKMMQLYVSYEVAMIIACKDEMKKLQHIAKALNKAYNYQVANENKDKKFFYYLLVQLDIRQPSNTHSIYAETSNPISKSLRAHLCIGLTFWLLQYLPEISTEVEVQLTELISGLLEDAIDRETVQFWTWDKQIVALETKLATLLVPPERSDQDEGNILDEENVESLTKELDELKDNKQKFLAVRGNVPNPVVIYSKTLEMADQLRDEIKKLEFSKFVMDTWTKATENTDE